MTRTLLALAAILALASPAGAQTSLADIPRYERPEPVSLTSEEIARFPAAEARQGVAVDAEHFYAVVNFAIGKYDRATGERVGGWLGPRGGLIGHLNSCFAENGQLWCANSNHPEVPMASSVEVFDAETMTHAASHSLGLMDEGSLVWFDHLDQNNGGDGWIVGFAHYADETGEPFKDNAYSAVHVFDAEWRRTGGWRLPVHLTDKMAPQGASGGALGADGLLYVFGHDLPEMYVLAKPAMGPTLLHVATIAVDAEGQAFAFDPTDDRVIWAISRPNGEVRAFRLPEVPLTMEHALRFE